MLNPALDAFIHGLYTVVLPKILIAAVIATVAGILYNWLTISASERFAREKQSGVTAQRRLPLGRAFLTLPTVPNATSR